MLFGWFAYNMCGEQTLTYMKSLKSVVILLLLSGFMAAPLTGSAEDAAKKPKPYPLNTCAVSGEKLGGDMGEPYVFTYKDKQVKDDAGREIKLCCKSCLKDFNKDTAGYLKKLDAAEAKAKK